MPPRRTSSTPTTCSARTSRSYVQYGKFVWRALHGDLGRTFRQQQGGFTVPSSTGEPVLRQVVKAAAVTGAIAFGGAILLFRSRSRSG